MIYTVFSNKKSLRTTYSSNPSGEPCTRDLFCLWANRDWSSFAGLIMEVTGHADHSSGNFSPDSGRFLVSGPADRTLPCKGGEAVSKGPVLAQSLSTAEVLTA